MDTLLLSGVDNTWVIITWEVSWYIDAISSTLPIESSFVQTIQHFLPAQLLAMDNLQFLVIVFLWVLVIFWVLKDSSYRSSNWFFPIFSLLLVTIATPIIWLPIYLAIRPIGYKYERAYWKLIMQGYKIADETLYEEEFLQEEDDQTHLAKLQQQATLAEKRNKTIVKKTPIKKASAPKKSPTKSSSRNIPTAKKAVKRIAK